MHNGILHDHNPRDASRKEALTRDTRGLAAFHGQLIYDGLQILAKTKCLDGITTNALDPATISMDRLDNKYGHTYNNLRVVDVKWQGGAAAYSVSGAGALLRFDPVWSPERFTQMCKDRVMTAKVLKQRAAHVKKLVKDVLDLGELDYSHYSWQDDDQELRSDVSSLLHKVNHLHRDMVNDCKPHKRLWERGLRGEACHEKALNKKKLLEMLQESAGLCQYSGMPMLLTSGGYTFMVSKERCNDDLGYTIANTRLVLAGLNEPSDSFTPAVIGWECNRHWPTGNTGNEDIGDLPPRYNSYMTPCLT